MKRFLRKHGFFLALAHYNQGMLRFLLILLLSFGLALAQPRTGPPSVAEGSRVVVMGTDLVTVLSEGTVENGVLRLTANLRPLSNLYLFVFTPTIDFGSNTMRTVFYVISAAVSPDANDILIVSNPGGSPLSFRVWLRNHGIRLELLAPTGYAPPRGETLWVS